MEDTMIKVLVFDFDGVIVRASEQFKQDAWDTLFPHGSEARAAFEEAEARYGRGRGGDRYDILRHVFASLGVNDEDMPATVALAAGRFDTIVQDRITAAGMDARDRAALEELAKLGYRLYLNSATPADALSRTVAALGIGQLFVEILGRPRSKVENFEYVAAREKAHPEEVVFVGDSPTDRAAAEAFGCRFIGFLNGYNSFGSCMTVHALDEIQAVVDHI